MQILARHPLSKDRSCWNVLNSSYILYDLVFISLQVGQVTPLDHKVLLLWSSTMVWSMDCKATFFVGYYLGGTRETRICSSLGHYLTTWLVVGFMLVMIRWICILFTQVPHSRRHTLLSPSFGRSTISGPVNVQSVCKKNEVKAIYAICGHQ